MRKLLLNATFLIVVFACIPNAAASDKKSSSDHDSYNQTVLQQVTDYKSAQAIAAPGACEKSTAWFVRIGEYGEHASTQVTREDFYQRTLAAQVDNYQSVWATVAPRTEPEARDDVAVSMPASMAFDAAAASATGDFYSQTIAAQFSLNRLIEAVNRF